MRSVVRFLGGGSILRRAAPRDENPAGDDDDHRRPLHGAWVHAHQHIDGEDERRMRGDNGRDHRDRPPRDADIEQHAHQRDAHAMENRDRDAERRPDEDLIRREEPNRRPDRPDQEDIGIVQDRAERPGREPRHKSAAPRLSWQDREAPKLMRAPAMPASHCGFAPRQGVEFPTSRQTHKQRCTVMLPTAVNFSRKVDWNLLKTFHEIAEAGGVSRAGRALRRKQPALSLALKRLETSSGSRCRRPARVRADR